MRSWSRRLVGLVALGVFIGWGLPIIQAQVGKVGSAGGAGSAFTGSGTTNTVAKFTGATALGNSTITDDATTVTVNTASKFNTAVANDNSKNFLSVAGTMPTTPTTTAVGVSFLLTGAGNAAQSPMGVQAGLLVGYTGASTTYGLFGSNASLGTAAIGGPAAGSGNFGLYGQVSSTGGGASSGIASYGVIGASSTTAKNFGVVGEIGSLTATSNVGVMGRTGNGTATNVGGYFSIFTTVAPVLTQTALLVENGNAASPIAVFRDNGTAKVDFTDNGGIVIDSGNGYTWSSTTDATASADLFLTRGGAATLQLGAANAASPVAQIVQGQGSRSGTDTDVAGGNVSVGPGIGTGHGIGSQFNVNRNIDKATGNTAQSVQNAFTTCESKTLSNTSATATALANITLPNNSAGAARVTVAVQCNDGTNFDSDIVTSYVAYVNKAGTLTIGTAVTTASAAANNSGSCTVTPTFVANGTTSIDIKVTPTIGTIVPTTTTGIINVENFGGAQGGGGVVACK